MAFREYGNFDAVGLADLVRRRQVTSAELIEEAIARAERVDPRIGSIITPTYEERQRRGGDQHEGLGHHPLGVGLR